MFPHPNQSNPYISRVIIDSTCNAAYSAHLICLYSTSPNPIIEPSKTIHIEQVKTADENPMVLLPDKALRFFTAGEKSIFRFICWQIYDFPHIKFLFFTTKIPSISRRNFVSVSRDTLNGGESANLLKCARNCTLSIVRLSHPYAGWPWYIFPRLSLRKPR